MKLQRGYTLLELAMTLVVSGLIVTIGASLYHQREQTQQAEIAEIQFTRADQALMGYVFANNALP
ncbi:MAG: prepilin-type N-terminal cleavage/methylation domain-containing protein, partial [Deltaproteobacteria bacterium]|nr:prepilin-type N-terminal cleavage/methylation domain-containing protein [Deltaproteobacteria bacterium]